MPRPRMRRRICGMPSYSKFLPENNSNGVINLLVEEYEVLRLIDYKRLTQEECSEVMGIARTSVQKMYDEARYKIAQVLVEGKTLLINGGNYYLCNDFSCKHKFCNL